MTLTAEASGTSTTAKTFAEKEELLKARALKRAERAEARRVKAEEHKRNGNAHYHKKDYRKAIAEYEVAVKIHGPTAIYLSNMAAAWLKLGSYDAAEECAKRALCLDPTFVKARFRRGVARKGNLQLAAARVDFTTILEKDPGNTGAKEALDEILVLMRERNEADEPIAWEDSRPWPDNDPKFELESVSDSSDWNHGGNGVACKYYNHDGCTGGSECRFSHAPDHKSVRDCLGRNVCVRFLLGECRLGSSACMYSHDKSYLPSGRWWENEGKRATIRDISRGAIVRQSPDSLPRLFAMIDARIAWTPAHAAKTEEAYVWRDNIMMLEGFGDITDDLEFAAYKTRGRVSRGGRDRGGGGSRGGMRRGGWYDRPEPEDLQESEERMNNSGDEVQPDHVCQCGFVLPGDDDDAFDVNFFIDAYSL